MEDTANDPRGKRRGLTEDGYAVFDEVDETGRKVRTEATLHDSGRRTMAQLGNYSLKIKNEELCCWFFDTAVFCSL